MAKLRINGDSSGYVDLEAPNAASSSTLDLDQVPQKNAANTFTSGQNITVPGNGGLTIQAGTNGSASLRLKNDATDWDVNCQTTDNFAIYNHTTGGNRLGITPAGIVTTPSQPGFRVYRNTAQTLSADSAVVVQLDTKLYDIGNNFNTSTHRFTAPVTGMYMFTGHILFDTSATLHRGQANLLKNGSRLAATQIALGGNNHCGGVFSSLGKLNAGDYIELQGQSETHGGSFYGSSDWTYLSGFLIG